MLAGLVDTGENAEVTAVRELWEETGYHGIVTSVSPRMFTICDVYYYMKGHYDFFNCM